MTAQERLSLLIEVVSVVTVPVALSLGIAGASEESLQVLLDDALDEYAALVGVPHPLDDAA
jgi:hypothetical protein